MPLRKRIDSVQTRCIAKGEAQKSPLFWRFSGVFCFSQERLFPRNSTRKPLNLIKSPISTNAPCKTACLYNAPSMHSLERTLGRDMGGAKRMGEENVSENACSRKFLDPSKRASGLLSPGFLYRKNRGLTPGGGWKTYRTRGGPKPLLGTGCHS